MLRLLMTGLMVIWLGFGAAPAWAAPLTSGAEIFEFHCAGCHVQGGNIIRRNKTLKLPALERNNLATEAAISTLVTTGKNNMPAFGDRLNPDQIQTVSSYILSQARDGWK